MNIFIWSSGHPYEKGKRPPHGLWPHVENDCPRWNCFLVTLMNELKHFLPTWALNLDQHNSSTQARKARAIIEHSLLCITHAVTRTFAGNSWSCQYCYLRCSHCTQNVVVNKTLSTHAPLHNLIRRSWVSITLSSSGVQRSGDARGDCWLDAPNQISSIEQWPMVLTVTGYTLFVTSQNYVIFTFAKQRFGEACWHNMHIQGRRSNGRAGVAEKDLSAMEIYKKKLLPIMLISVHQPSWLQR